MQSTSNVSVNFSRLVSLSMMNNLAFRQVDFQLIAWVFVNLNFVKKTLVVIMNDSTYM